MVPKPHSALEYIIILFGFWAGRIRTLCTDQFAQFDEEEGIIGSLGAATPCGPTLDEGFNVRV